MRIRFRVDGVLYEAARVPKRMISGVVSRIKIMSELDIAEKRLPQDGRVSVNVEDRKVDLRITTLPTQRGEGATIRILDKEQALRSLDELGMGGAGRTTLPGVDQQVARRGAGHRADRLGEVDQPLCRARRAERGREQDHHDRGPGRVPDRRHQPDQRQPQGGAHLRGRVALDPARRPRHHHGRRDSRRRDRPDRDRVGADRPHGALDPAHQRRPGHDHPAGEDGDRDLPHRLGPGLRRRPAPGAQALHALQAARRDPAVGAARGGLPGRRRRRGLRADRLRALQPDAATAAGSGSSR